MADGSTLKAVITIASMVGITAIVVACLHHVVIRYRQTISRQRGLHLHVRCGDREYLPIARKRALPVLRRCDVVRQVMGRIWITMGMGWGVSLGESD